jgi:hypothetical protein
MRSIIISFCFLACVSCSSIRYVEFDVDKSINFKKFKTYAWVPSHDQQYADQRYNNQIIENNIKSYAATAIVAKGLVLNVDSPDILFFYDLQIEKGTHTVQTPIYSHPHNFMPPPMMPMQPGVLPNQQLAQQQMMQQQWMMQQWMTPQIIGYETRQIPFKNGTLTVVAIERATNRMIWRGWSESCVTDPLNYRDNLERKIQLIFRNFPTVRM